MYALHIMDMAILCAAAIYVARLQIIVNPPFVGARQMKEGSEQKQDMLHVFGSKWKNLGNLDYVCGWYKKATDISYFPYRKGLFGQTQQGI